MPRGTTVRVMNTAERVLVVYGVAILVYGLVLGVPMAAIRRTSPEAPRHLVNAHLSALMQAPIALGLAFALAITAATSSWATVGAWVFIAGLALEALGGTLNWLRGTGDQFAERSPGYLANAISGPLAVAGGVILAIVVVTSV
jgi:hypothetical protein